MITISNLFKQYVESNNREFEIKADINGIIYDNTKVVEFQREGNLAPTSTIVIGEVLVQKMTLKIKTTDIIPENAKIIVYIRMNGLSGYTEWIQIGVYYVDSRKRANGVWEFTCYDKMMFANQKFVSALIYPATMTDVLNEIATQLGVTIDASVTLNAYNVPYKDEDIMIRDVLSYISSSHGKSFRMTSTEAFKFVEYKSSSLATIKPTAYFRALQTNPIKSFTKLRVVYNSEGEYLEVGDGDADHTMEVYNPYAFTDVNILNGMFAAVNGISYIPFELDWKGNVFTEIGDTISIEELDNTTWLENYNEWVNENRAWESTTPFTSILLNDKFTFKNGLKCVSNSPSDSQQKSEFKYEGSITKQVKAAVKENKSYYGVTIGKTNGLKITHSSGHSEVILNSDKFAFQVDGVDVLYFDPVNRKYKFTGDVTIANGSITIDSLNADLGGRISFIDGNGVFSGSIDVDNDVYIGDDLFFKNGLSIRDTAGGFGLFYNTSELLSFYSNALYVRGDCISGPPGYSIGVIVDPYGYGSKITMYQNSMSIGGTSGASISLVCATTAQNTLSVSGQLTASSTFRHTGSYLAFFGGSSSSKTSVSYPTSLYTTQTAASTYGSNEQTMLGNIKTDLSNIRSTLYNLIDALKDYNLV